MASEVVFMPTCTYTVPLSYSIAIPDISPCGQTLAHSFFILHHSDPLHLHDPSTTSYNIPYGAVTLHTHAHEKSKGKLYFMLLMLLNIRIYF